MTRSVRLWTVTAGELALAAAIVALAADPHRPAAAREAVFAALGLTVGTLLFALLAYPARPRLPPPSRRRLLPGVLLYFGGRAFAEEVIWRFLLYGSLAAMLSPPLAAVVIVVAFAGAHAIGQGAGAIVTHAVTGGAFTALYASTHSLLAAGAAHAAYNLLVASTLFARKGLP